MQNSLLAINIEERTDLPFRTKPTRRKISSRTCTETQLRILKTGKTIERPRKTPKKLFKLRSFCYNKQLKNGQKRLEAASGTRTQRTPLVEAVIDSAIMLRRKTHDSIGFHPATRRSSFRVSVLTPPEMIETAKPTRVSLPN